MTRPDNSSSNSCTLGNQGAPDTGFCPEEIEGLVGDGDYVPGSWVKSTRDGWGQYGGFRGFGCGSVPI